MGMVSGKPKLSNEDRDRLAYQTKWHPYAVESEYKKFIKRHPDGKILKQDFSHEMQSAIPYTNALKLEQLVFQVFDQNKDGFIDFKEYMLVFHLLVDGSAEEKTRKVFQLCDKDKDGTVSYEELNQFLSLFSMEDMTYKLMQERRKYSLISYYKISTMLSEC